MDLFVDIALALCMLASLGAGLTILHTVIPALWRRRQWRGVRRGRAAVTERRERGNRVPRWALVVILAAALVVGLSLTARAGGGDESAQTTVVVPVDDSPWDVVAAVGTGMAGLAALAALLSRGRRR